MLSFIYHDKFIYHYPNTKKQLSEDLEKKFPQDWSLSIRFRVLDNLEAHDTFAIKYRGSSYNEITASVKPNGNGLDIEMEIGGDPTTPVVVLLAAVLLIRIFGSNGLNSNGFALVTILFLSPIILLMTGMEYYHKKRLKKYFEEYLGLPVNNNIVKKSYKWLIKRAKY